MKLSIKHLATKTKIIALLCAAAIFWTASVPPLQAAEDEIPAGGLQTDFGDVLIENLGIGRTYNLREIAGKPMKVQNTGKWTIDLLIDVQIPPEDMILESRRDKGYKPIPSIDWVSVTPSQFILPSKESAFTDVIIKIPNDPTLYGKKFQASIFSRSTGKRFLNLGVWSHLLLTIVPSPEDQVKMETNRKKGVVEAMEYTLIPDKLVISGVPLGKKVDIFTEAKKTIRIANSGTTPIELRTEIVPVGSSPLTMQEGYEQPDLNWISLKGKTITVEGSAFADPGLVLNFPNNKKLAGKKYMFVLKVEPANHEIVGVTFYGKIYVETEHK